MKVINKIKISLLSLAIANAWAVTMGIGIHAIAPLAEATVFDQITTGLMIGNSIWVFGTTLFWILPKIDKLAG